MKVTLAVLVLILPEATWHLPKASVTQAPEPPVLQEAETVAPASGVSFKLCTRIVAVADQYLRLIFILSPSRSPICVEPAVPGVGVGEGSGAAVGVGVGSAAPPE